MCIPTNLRAKDLVLITGKGLSQCRIDFTAIKKAHNKPGRKSLVTHQDVADFYKLKVEQIPQLLTLKNH